MLPNRVVRRRIIKRVDLGIAAGQQHSNQFSNHGCDAVDVAT